MNRDKKNIIGKDFQGWPIYKQSLRDLIEEIAEKDESGNYIIKTDDPRLDLFPRTLEDDGMGYGVNEKYISEINVQPDYINLFIESIDENKISD